MKKATAVAFGYLGVVLALLLIGVVWMMVTQSYWPGAGLFAAGFALAVLGGVHGFIISVRESPGS